MLHNASYPLHNILFGVVFFPSVLIQRHGAWRRMGIRAGVSVRRQAPYGDTHAYSYGAIVPMSPGFCQCKIHQKIRLADFNDEEHAIIYASKSCYNNLPQEYINHFTMNKFVLCKTLLKSKRHFVDNGRQTPTSFFDTVPHDTNGARKGKSQSIQRPAAVQEGSGSSQWQ